MIRNEMMHFKLLKSTECNVLRKIFWLKRKRETEKCTISVTRSFIIVSFSIGIYSIKDRIGTGEGLVAGKWVCTKTAQNSLLWS
jgi:hypothetical protein